MSPKDQLLMAPLKQQSSLAMHTNFSPITKSRPKVRIVHIFAPEIIKTDAENFRDLVQRLTGKPTKSVDSDGRKRKRSETRNAQLPAVVDRSERTRKQRGDGVDSKFCDGAERATSEEEEMETLWMEDSSCESSNCLRGLEEIDGFIQELRDLL